MPYQAKQRPDPPGTTHTTLYGAQTRRTQAQAALEELKLRKETGELVLRSAVEQATFASGRRVRDGLQNLPARLSGIFAAESDQARIFALFSAEIQQVLEGLAE